MKIIRILLVLFCVLPIIVKAQTSKQIWTKAELVSPQGQTIHKWNAESFTQFITQKVCKKGF